MHTTLKENDKYCFKEINVNVLNPRIKIIYAFKDGKSEALDNFTSLNISDKIEVKSLVKRLALSGIGYQSPKIKWNLHGVSYGELRPLPHRFFFFRGGKNELIFFGYAYKDQNKLPASLYKHYEIIKEEYEKEYKKTSRT